MLLLSPISIGIVFRWICLKAIKKLMRPLSFWKHIISFPSLFYQLKEHCAHLQAQGDSRQLHFVIKALDILRKYSEHRPKSSRIKHIQNNLHDWLQICRRQFSFIHQLFVLLPECTQAEWLRTGGVVVKA